MRIDKSDIPPGAEAAVRRFQNSLAEVATRAARLDRLADEPIAPFTGIDEQRLNSLARSSYASPELAAAARAVERGECSWREIVEGHRRQPPEIVDLISSGIPFAFTIGRLAPAGAPPPDRTSSADPSRADDPPYDDDYPPRSWLV